MLVEPDSNGRLSLALFYIITIFKGLTSPGGITDFLTAESPEKEEYYARFVFDILFWIIINFFFFYLIMGLLVDTFGELR